MFSSWEVQQIPQGLAGIRATVEAMAQLVRDAQLAPITREATLSILNRTRPRSVQAGAAAFRDFVRRSMNLINEPVELLQRPEWLLSELSQGNPIWGDCDDAAMLTAALTTAAGLSTQLRAVWPPGVVTGDGHVFAEVLDDSARMWRPVDPTQSAFDGRMPPQNWDSMSVII